MREDYERFCQIFAREVLQTWKSDKYYLWNYGKIRRLGTEYIHVRQEHMKYRPGISINIFPYDYLPIDEKIYQEILSKVYMEMAPPELRYAVAPASKIDFGSVFQKMEWCAE